LQISQDIAAADETQVDVLDAASILAHFGELPVHIALDGKGRCEPGGDGHYRHGPGAD
jgi:hypothetical protein